MVPDKQNKSCRPVNIPGAPSGESFVVDENGIIWRKTTFHEKRSTGDRRAKLIGNKLREY
jgi:hypothetical protein